GGSRRSAVHGLAVFGAHPLTAAGGTDVAILSVRSVASLDIAARFANAVAIAAGGGGGAAAAGGGRGAVSPGPTPGPLPSPTPPPRPALIPPPTPGPAEGAST